MRWTVLMPRVGDVTPGFLSGIRVRGLAHQNGEYCGRVLARRRLSPLDIAGLASGQVL
jgi:hypothetical protein